MHPNEYLISAQGDVLPALSSVTGTSPTRDAKLSEDGVEALPEGPAEVIGDQGVINAPEALSDAGVPVFPISRSNKFSRFGQSPITGVPRS